MPLEEKQKIAAYARELIRLLDLCGESDFVDLVLECVSAGDPVPLEPENL